MKLLTTYLGLTLAHPFIAGASPLAGDLDHAKRLEDGGAAAIVLHSLFEEQITMDETGRIHGMDPSDPRFTDLLATYPTESAYALNPDDYLEHVRRLKDALAIPVIGSLNGVTRQVWLKTAVGIAQAGADALELNMYEVAADPEDSGAAIEGRLRDVILDLKRMLTIPIAVKLSPYFTTLTHMARQLDAAGADGLVLFNRFYQPDIDLATLTVQPRIALSTSAELLLRLRWIAALRGTVRASLALSGGVANAEDGIKGLLAGADVVQIVSGALRDGPGIFRVMRKGLVQWMKRREFTSIDDVRGRVRFERVPIDVSARARGAYLQTLQSWPKTD
jgi:dihydroorotate dehydrogenase (fumarate)